MLVLGIGGFLHDYNCCLVDVERGRVAIREAERQSRRKHHVAGVDEDLLVPIRACCDDLGVRVEQIKAVAFAHTDPFPVKDRLRSLLSHCEFHEIDHHVSHAAAAFFSSPYEKAAIVSLDGFGDGASGLLLSGHGNVLEPLVRISDEDSIGLEYLRATVHIGLGGTAAKARRRGSPRTASPCCSTPT